MVARGKIQAGACAAQEWCAEAGVALSNAGQQSAAARAAIYAAGCLGRCSSSDPCPVSSWLSTAALSCLSWLLPMSLGCVCVVELQHVCVADSPFLFFLSSWFVVPLGAAAAEAPKCVANQRLLFRCQRGCCCGCRPYDRWVFGRRCAECTRAAVREVYSFYPCANSSGC